MIVDSSAILSILRNEPDAPALALALQSSEHSRISAASWLEAAVVTDSSRDPVASRDFENLVQEARITIEPVTEEQVKIARAAYRDFGKGSKHSARLNFGDCFAYALARVTGEPLLYTGNDFSQTDVKSALYATS